MMKTTKRIEKLLCDFEESGLLPHISLQENITCCSNCYSPAQMPGNCNMHTQQSNSVEEKDLFQTKQNNECEGFQENNDTKRMKECCNNHTNYTLNFMEEDDEWKMLIKALQELPLQDFGVVKPIYNELLQIPNNQRKSKDCILILLLQKILEFNEQLVLVSKQQEQNTRIWTAALSAANEEIQRITNELHLKNASFECSKEEFEERIISLTTQLQQALSEKDQFCNEFQRLSHELIKEKQHVSHHLQQIQSHTTSNIIDTNELRAEIEKWTAEICESNANARYIEQYVQCDVIEKIDSSTHQSMKFSLKNKLDDILCSLAKLPSIDTNDCQILSEEINKITTIPLIPHPLVDDSYKTSDKYGRSLQQNSQLQNISSCSEQHVRFYLQHLSQELQKLFATIVFENDMLQNQLQEVIQYEKLNVQKVKNILQKELQIASNTLVSQRQKLETKLEKVTKDFIQISLEKDTLQHDIDVKTNELIRSSTKNSSQQQEFENVSNELTKVSLKNDLLESEIIKLKNELIQASSKNTLIQQQFEKMTIELTEIHLEKSLLEPEVKKMTTELSRIYSDKNLLQHEVENLKHQLTIICSEKDVLKLEVEKITTEMSRKFFLEKGIMQHEVQKLKEDLQNEKQNAKNSKQALQEELQDIVSTWVVQKKDFESRVDKLLEDVAKISLERDMLQHDFDKFKLMTKCEEEKSSKDLILLSSDGQINTIKAFSAKKPILIDLSENKIEGLQHLKMPVQCEIKNDNLYKMKESLNNVEGERQYVINEGTNQLISTTTTNKNDTEEHLKRISNENTRLKLKEEQLELPKKLTKNDKRFEQHLSHSLFDMRLENAFGKRPQQYDIEVLQYRERTQKEIDRIKWIASKLAQEEMNLEDLQEPLGSTYT